jgi:hypothetical protein
MRAKLLPSYKYSSEWLIIALQLSQQEAYMETAKELNRAQQIIEMGDAEQASLIMDLIQKKFRDKDYEVLAKMNAYYEQGYLTVNEYLTRVTVILHEIEIAEHSRR